MFLDNSSDKSELRAYLKSAANKLQKHKNSKVLVVYVNKIIYGEKD